MVVIESGCGGAVQDEGGPGGFLHTLQREVRAKGEKYYYRYAQLLVVRMEVSWHKEALRLGFSGWIVQMVLADGEERSVGVCY